MRSHERLIFINLFRESCQKCFGFPLESPLSETDSKLLSNRILDQTGLVIGAKSIKNYSFYVLSSTSGNPKGENPSEATLDTLARYVLDAPHTDEVSRKDLESHFPYWFEYRSRFAKQKSTLKRPLVNARVSTWIIILFVVASTTVMLIKMNLKKPEMELFRDNFDSVAEKSLRSRGWLIKWTDTGYWNKRDELKGHLALYTLRGDNWPLEGNPARINNLLMRRIDSPCFVTEVNLDNFIPDMNWQQAGILLSEDSTFTGKMIRLSIAYNDFFGGYNKPPEIIIQILSSSESGSLSKPEEIAHFPLFSIEPDKKNIAISNLAKSALKIEKRGKHVRFLYTTSSKESFAFREVLSRDFNFQPRYVSIFSIAGWSDNSSVPAYFDSFSLDTEPCNK